MLLLGVIFALALAGVLVFWGARYEADVDPLAGHRIVTLDMVKLAAAERGGVVSNIGQGAALPLTRIGSRAEAVIRQVAGPGTIVLARQAVVSGNFPDITDTVIKALNLSEGKAGTASQPKPSDPSSTPR